MSVPRPGIGVFKSVEAEEGIALPDSGVTPGAYTNTNLTVNEKGIVTAAANGSTGSGGNAIGSTAFGSEPGSPASGDVDMYSDSNYLARYNGSIWVPWGPIYPLTKPIDGDFAWVNQGSATVDATKGPIYLEAPAVTGTNLRVRKKSAPSTPYTITVAFLPTTQFYQLFGNLSTFGLMFRQSSDGKLEGFVLGLTNGMTVSIMQYSDAQNFNAGIIQDHYIYPTSPVWLRIADNGTNRIYSTSGDGIHFTPIYTVGRTSFLTANEVGFFCTSMSNTRVGGVSLLSWKEA